MLEPYLLDLIPGKADASASFDQDHAVRLDFDDQFRQALLFVVTSPKREKPDRDETHGHEG